MDEPLPPPEPMPPEPPQEPSQEPPQEQKPVKTAAMLAIESIKSDTTEISQKLDQALSPDPDQPSALAEIPEMLVQLQEAMIVMNQALQNQSEALAAVREDNKYLAQLLRISLGMEEPPAQH